MKKLIIHELQVTSNDDKGEDEDGVIGMRILAGVYWRETISACVMPAQVEGEALRVLLLLWLHMSVLRTLVCVLPPDTLITQCNTHEKNKRLTYVCCF